MLSAPLFSQIRLLVDSLTKNTFAANVEELQQVSCEGGTEGGTEGRREGCELENVSDDMKIGLEFLNLQSRRF